MPESVTGRAIAPVLMLVGISLIGMITANLASLFLDPLAAGDGAERSSAASEEASTADETARVTSTELLSLEERLVTIEHNSTRSPSNSPGEGHDLGFGHTCMHEQR